MSLSAAEGGLHLDDRVAALALQAFFHDSKEVLKALGQVGFLEEQIHISVLFWPAPLVDFPQVGGKHIQGQTALQDVIVWNGDGMKGFHKNLSSS
ncbi:hypothetical protein [Anaerolinea sp.]|uniref:hypothetical protein n=1 Tax=Anaerolinea sp. TaxID=1872519 RepID=UPI0026165125|nr:hypothetical protein [uncultured Anaerolinea sp.]